MSEIAAVVEWVLSLVSDNLYPGVFLASFIETVFPPIPSEAVFPLAGYVILQNDLGPLHVITVGITGGAGSTVGSFILYFAALKLGRQAIMRYLKKVRIREAKMARVEKWVSKHGDKSVLFGQLIPGIRSIISIPAGLFGIGFKKFAIYTFVGSCIWSIALTAVGYYLGVAVIDII